MLLRLRFIASAVCCGFDFHENDEILADSDHPTTFYAVHRLDPVWAEVVDLVGAGVLVESSEPFTAAAVIQMVERRLAAASPAEHSQTG